jgi:LmbE family N-acetylglucosaminyl deacetylase
MRILAIAAHPDDLELLCGGTLARFAARGDHVIMAHACRGDKGHTQIPPARLAEVRDEEATAAAAVLGAEAMCLDFPDGEIHVSDTSTRRVADAIRIAKPDLIITHDPADYHGDHTAVSQLVMAASYIATAPYYVTDHPAHLAVSPVYFMDTLAGINFMPGEYVDITDTLALKKQAMARHASQLSWIKEHHDTDILEFIEVVARFRGLQCGVKYAEAFRCMPAWGRLSPRRWLP